MTRLNYLLQEYLDVYEVYARSCRHATKKGGVCLMWDALSTGSQFRHFERCERFSRTGWCESVSTRPSGSRCANS